MLKRFLQKNKKVIVGLALILLVLTPITTHADLVDIVGSSLKILIASIFFIPLQIATFLLYLAGQILDFVVGYTIVDIKKNIDGISGINIAWAVIRDLVNISFIFILLYASIMTILGKGDGMIKKSITGVVIAAILVNFSLFFTKVIIDTSNLVTITFHEAIVTTCSKSGKKAELSGCFTESLKLTTLFDPNTNSSAGTLERLGEDVGRAATISIGSLIFILIATFVFLAMAIMLLVRFVTIVFLLIFSPFAVIGSLLPQLSSHSKRWWKDLTDQAIFPPVFMILVWVVLTIISSSGFIGLSTAKNFAEMFVEQPASGAGTSPDFISLIFNFAIIITMLIGTLTISKSFAGKGGEMGSKYAGSLLGGGVGIVGRRSAGRLGNRFAESEKLKEAASKGGLRGAGARLALRGARDTAKSSFDLRGANSNISKQLGAGSATGKGGFEKIAKDKVEADKKYAESLKVSDLEKARVENNLEQAKKDVKNKVDGAEEEIRLAKDAIAVKRASAVAQAETLVAQKTPEMITAENNLIAAELLANNTTISDANREQARQQAAQHKAEVERLKQERVNNVKTRAEQILNTTATAEKASLAAAEAKLEEANKGVNSERTALIKAQIESDRLKGINAEEIKNRMKDAKDILEADKKIDLNQIDKDLANNTINQVEADRRKAEIQRMLDDGTKMKEAKAKLFETTGKFIPDDEESIKSVDTQRMTSYSESLTTSGLVSKNRVGFVGKISRENQGAALAIRRATKEKSNEQKLADAAKAIAKKDEEDKKKDEKPEGERSGDKKADEPTSPTP